MKKFLLLVAAAIGFIGCEKSDVNNIVVEELAIDFSSMPMVPGTFHTFDLVIIPVDADENTLVWSSSKTTVATVDQSGKVAAIGNGTTTITAAAEGGASASCTIEVKAMNGSATLDYIDEYGVNQGKGIVIGDIVWAPVNCGYKAASTSEKGYVWGKLYQWGRKYGQGFSTDFDSTAPTIAEGPVDSSVGNSAENTNLFFTSTTTPNDWCKVPDNKLWNNGTEENPVKSNNDPCPEGWRVPTKSELETLSSNFSTFTKDSYGYKGRYFSGEYTYINEAPKLFLPVSGIRYYDGNVYFRDEFGGYWSSTINGSNANSLGIENNQIYMSTDGRAHGYSLRCVQE